MFYCCSITVLLFIRALGNIFTFVIILHTLPHTHTLWYFSIFFRITFIALLLLLLLLFSCLHLAYHPLPAVIERNSRAKATINAFAKVGRHRYLRRFFADLFIVFIIVVAIVDILLFALHTHTHADYWGRTRIKCEICLQV